MASISTDSEMAGPSDNVSREQEAYVAGHTGAFCDDCGCAHAYYPVTQRGAEYMLCESCYEYACMVAESESEAEAEADMSEDEEEFPAADEYDYNMMAETSGW